MVIQMSEKFAGIDKNKLIADAGNDKAMTRQKVKDTALEVFNILNNGGFILRQNQAIRALFKAGLIRQSDIKEL